MEDALWEAVRGVRHADRYSIKVPHTFVLAVRDLTIGNRVTVLNAVLRLELVGFFEAFSSSGEEQLLLDLLADLSSELNFFLRRDLCSLVNGSYSTHPTHIEGYKVMGSIRLFRAVYPLLDNIDGVNVRYWCADYIATLLSSTMFSRYNIWQCSELLSFLSEDFSSFFFWRLSRKSSWLTSSSSASS